MMAFPGLFITRTSPTCDAIEFASAYRIHLAAQYIAEVAERLIPEREVNERLIRLFLAVLRSLKHSGEVTRPGPKALTD